MTKCQGICNSKSYGDYKCSGTVKRINVEGWQDIFWYCDTAINICKKAYRVTILDSNDNDCETNDACTCDMNIIMLRGCQCGGN